MHVPLKSKTTLILGGVFPVAFYGIAMLPLGVAHIDGLRKLCADGLFDVSHSRNSALAVVATPNMLDPLEYIVITAIRTVRRFLLQLPMGYPTIVVAQLVYSNFGCRSLDGRLIERVRLMFIVPLNYAYVPPAQPHGLSGFAEHGKKSS